MGNRLTSAIFIRRNAMAKINTTNLFPYNQIIETSDINLGDCVRIPKIFVKNSVTESGLITRMISNEKIEGYHCHPAFMQDGHERNAILIQKTTPSTQQEKTFSESQSAIKALNNQDYHMYNIFEHSLLSLLALIEYGTTNLHEVYIDNYHGIILADNDDIWLNGIDTNGTNGALRIFDNLGNFTMQDTKISFTTNLPVYAKTFSGENFSTEDCFLDNVGEGSLEGGSFGGMLTINQNSLAVIRSRGTTTFDNFFSIIINKTTTSKRFFKICKFSD